MLLVIPLLQAEEVVYLNEFSMNALFASRLQLADSRDVDAGALEQQWEFAESLFINATTAVSVTYTGFDDGLPNSAAIPVDRSVPFTSCFLCVVPHLRSLFKNQCCRLARRGAGRPRGQRHERLHDSAVRRLG